MKPKQAFSTFKLPQSDDFLVLIKNTIKVLRNENEVLRPKDETGLPGAFLDIASFNNSIPVVLIPDLHARLDFFYEILDFKFLFDEQASPMTIKKALEKEKVFVVCVGDGLHAEKRAHQRWLEAQKEWLHGNAINESICAEMEEGLGLMTLIMELKQQHPNHFHFLKGNHENILNELACGNLPFKKFANEGEMVKEFMLTLYGNELTQLYSDFEYNLPLFVRGVNFLVSHAEPLRAFSREELIDAFLDKNTVLGLTWTPNNEAEEHSVEEMLETLLPNHEDAVYFAGHRTFLGTHKILRNGKFIQIHNPNKHYISIVHPSKAFNPTLDIYDTSTKKRAEESNDSTTKLITGE